MSTTPARVGKLYAYFLEMSDRIISCIVHQDMNLPRTGDRMYHVLENTLANGNREEYNNLIWNDISLTNIQKELLTPANGVINTVKLDFSIYLKIIKFLQGETKRKDIIYLSKTRNYLCHFGLQEYMGEPDFREQLYLMTCHFKNFNFPEDLLESIVNDICNF